MKLSRLYQPRNPKFWLLIAINVPSAGISYLLHNRELPIMITLVMTACALVNFVIGIYLARQLMREAPQQ